MRRVLYGARARARDGRYHTRVGVVSGCCTRAAARSKESKEGIIDVGEGEAQPAAASGSQLR